jgi:hypothetical protein
MNRLKLAIKGFVLVLSLVLSLEAPNLLIRLFTFKILFFNVYHVLWLAIVIILIKRMIPGLNRKISSGKIFKRKYVPGLERTPIRDEKLRSYVAKMNRGALKTAVYWSVVILVAGWLYYLDLFGVTGLFIIVVFFVFMDQFCVSVWCPFEWLIGNKCCNSCRINNWGYLMAFLPLIFLPSFWTYSVLLLSAAVASQWEYLFFRHPERFFEVYHAGLACRNCLDRCGSRKRHVPEPEGSL